MALQQMTLGLSEHRPEMISRIARAMRKHQAIFLEEPADSDFDQMLSGTRPVEEYLSGLDAEYPEFSRDMCYLLRKLKRGAKRSFRLNLILKFFSGFIPISPRETAPLTWQGIRSNIRFTWPKETQRAR